MERKILPVRLLPSLSEPLRAQLRKRGDLSHAIEDAIAKGDLAEMELVRLHGRPPRSDPRREKVEPPTTASLSLTTYDAIMRAALVRRTSKNIIINSALLCWLKPPPSQSFDAKPAATPRPMRLKARPVIEPAHALAAASLAKLSAQPPSGKAAQLRAVYLDIERVRAVGHSLQVICSVLASSGLTCTPHQVSRFLTKERARRARLETQESEVLMSPG